MMLICSNIFCYHGSVLDPTGYMFDIIFFFIVLKTEKENVRTGRILMHFPMEFLTLNQGGHTNNAIPKDRWPTVGLLGGTMEPLACDVPFKGRMCVNFCLFGDVFEGCWKVVVFMDEFLWWWCIFWVFHAFFWLVKAKHGDLQDQTYRPRLKLWSSQVMCGYTSKKWTLPKILGIRIKIKQKFCLIPFFLIPICFFDP